MYRIKQNAHNKNTLCFYWVFFLDILTNFVYLFEYLNSFFYHVKIICAALLLLCKMSGMMYSYPCCC